jgi:hypothetical protein
LRRVPISDDGETFRPDALFQLLAFGFFPESEEDRGQALAIAEVEAARYRRVGVEEYRPSFLLKQAIDALDRRSAKALLVGLVCLEACRLARFGIKPSIERAANVVAEAVAMRDTIFWYRIEQSQPKLKTMKATCDPASIKKDFRAYRSVAHIHAARATATYYGAVIPLWEPAQTFYNSLISTCADLERQFCAAIDTRAWNVWHLGPMPREAEDYPPFDPNPDIEEWLGSAELRMGLRSG